MTKSGLADSPFFKHQVSPIPPVSPAPVTPVLAEPSVVERPMEKQHLERKQSRNSAVMQANQHESNHAWLQESVIQLIRKAVKELGKEPATYRFTPEEKKALMEITYAHKVLGYKTSENELARIAINFIVVDYKENGEKSILLRVLNALKE